MKRSDKRPVEPITQAELRRAFFLASEIRRMKEQHDEMMEDFYLRLKYGAEIEPGTHDAQILVKSKGRVKTEQVVVR